MCEAECMREEILSKERRARDGIYRRCEVQSTEDEGNSIVPINPISPTGRANSYGRSRQTSGHRGARQWALKFT